MPTTVEIHEALGHSSHSEARRLQTALTRCGHDWFGTFLCNRAACESCRGRYIGRQRRAATKRFAALGNEALSLASIVIGGTNCLEDVPAMWSGFRKDLRNIVDSMRRRDGLWALTEFVVWLEIDAVSADDFSRLPPEKRVQLGELASAIGFGDEPIWIVTCHGIVAHPMQTSGRIHSRLAQRWPVLGQVHLRPFYQWNDPATNIARVVNYSLKYEASTSLESRDDDDFTSIEDKWPLSWVAKYHAFLNGWSRGFQSTRISIGRRFAKSSRCGRASTLESHDQCSLPLKRREVNTALLPLSLTDGDLREVSAAVLIRNLPSASELEGRYKWPPSSSIPIAVGRGDDDRHSRIAEMREFNVDSARGRWRVDVPGSKDEVTFHFEDDYDAVLFRLRFG